MTKASLHDIAPRLAVARDTRKWEIDWLGYHGGRDSARVHYAVHTTGRCNHCGGIVDRYEMDLEVLEGINKGSRGLEFDYKCRSCGVSGCSNYRRPW